MEQVKPVAIDHPAYAQLKAMGVPDQNLSVLWTRLGERIDPSVILPGSIFLTKLIETDLTNLDNNLVLAKIISKLSSSVMGTMPVWGAPSHRTIR